MAIPRHDPRPKPYPRHNLPAVSVQFFGHKAEKETLFQYLRTWETRFGITGPGGIGKTAFALKIGRRFVDGYAELPENERFAAVIRVSAKRVVLTARATRHPRAVVANLRDLYRVAMRTLGLRVRRASSLPAGDYGAAIRAAFDEQPQPVLLILDGFEDVTDDQLRRFAQEFGERQPELGGRQHKLIVTSRTMHGIGWPIRLHALPDTELDQYITSEWQRRGVEYDAETVREVVQEAHGLPLAAWLAIELGTRYPTRSVPIRLAEARARLDHYVLGETINQLKTEHPRSYYLLLTLAFFNQQQGATTTQLASAWKDGTIEACRKPLDVLLERNLVYVAGNDTGTSADARYAMLPHIRHYALAEGRRTPKMRRWEARARQRWCQSFLDMAHAYGGQDRLFWSDHFDPIAQDWLNFRTVMDWCMEHGDYATLQDLWSSEGVEPFTDLDGRGWPYRLEVLNWLVTEAEHRADWRFAVAMRSCAGWTYAQMGKLARATEQYCIALRHRKDAALEVQCELVSNLAELHLRQMLRHKALAQETLMRASRAKARAQLRLHGELLRHTAHLGRFSPDQMARQEINGLYYRGWLYSVDQQFARAEACFRAVKEIAANVAFERARAYADTWLGYILMCENDYAGAADSLRRAQRVLDLNRDARGQARVAYVTALLEERKWQQLHEDCLDQALLSALDARKLYEQLDMEQELERANTLINRVRAWRQTGMGE